MFIPSAIKSIQPFAVSLTTPTFSGTSALTAVNINSTILIPTKHGVNEQSGTVNGGDLSRSVLTSSTLVTCAVEAFYSGATVNIGGYAIEFYPGFVTSVQYKTVSLNLGVLSNTVAITSVVTAKSFIIPLGVTSAVITPMDMASVSVDLVLTSSILVTASRIASNGLVTVGFLVFESK